MTLKPLPLFIALLFSSIAVFAQPMSGTYEVDHNGTGQYDSLSHAVQDLNQRGMSGPVKFRIKAGIYTEKWCLVT